MSERGGGAWTVCRFKGWGSLAKKRGMVILRGGGDTLMHTVGWGLVFWTSNLFLLKKIGFALLPAIMQSETYIIDKKSINYGAIQRSHLLMIRLHRLSAKSNKTRGQFECDMTSFCLMF